MIRVIHRRRLAPGQSEASFVAAWRRAMAAIFARARAARSARLLRRTEDPGAFVSVVHWDSEDAWRSFWGPGALDPEGDLRRGVELAANLGRDTDTIATMTGAICGAVAGDDAIPTAWFEALGPDAVRDAEDLASRLAGLARSKAADREARARAIPGLVDGEGG